MSEGTNERRPQEEPVPCVVLVGNPKAERDPHLWDALEAALKAQGIAPVCVSDVSEIPPEFLKASDGTKVCAVFSSRSWLLKAESLHQKAPSWRLFVLSWLPAGQDTEFPWVTFFSKEDTSHAKLIKTVLDA